MRIVPTECDLFTLAEGRGGYPSRARRATAKNGGFNRPAVPIAAHLWFYLTMGKKSAGSGALTVTGPIP